MEPIKLNDIVKACGGEFTGDSALLDTEIKNISTDSREIGESCLFIPLVGDIHDGHDYIETAFKNGCLCTLSQKKQDRDNCILVEDTLAAMRDIAEYYRGLFDIKVIAVTGSVGKTTVKEMAAVVLSEKYNVLKNHENYNNEIGLSKTIFNLNKQHEIAVLEMGMNNFGEIRRLSKTARPDMCIIINIGDAHIGRLGSRDGIFQAKTEIFEYMKEGGEVFLYGDDDMLVSLNESNLNPIFFGESSYNHVSVSEIKSMGLEGTEMTVNLMGEKFDMKIPVPGKHLIPSALCAAAVGNSMGLNAEQIRNGMAKLVLPKMRNEIIKTGNITIVNDSYNSCEDSVMAGLEILELAEGRKVAILGDILEVGEHAQRVHYSVGKNAALKNVDLFICCGKQSVHTYVGLKEAGRANTYYFENKDAMHGKLGEIIKPGDAVYVKASRGCAFETTVEVLKKL